MNKQKLVTGIAIPVIVALGVFGFAAMSTNPRFTVPTWLPTLFFVLAVLMTVALVFYLMWGLLKRIRFQCPIILIGQQGKTNAVPLNKTIKAAPRRLEHDGVLWEDGGNDGYGRVNVIGPLCPKDYTPLSMKHNNKIEANLKYDTVISNSGYHSQLVCLECHTEYTLGNEPKQINASDAEVAIRFTGMRKRERENQAG